MNGIEVNCTEKIDIGSEDKIATRITDWRELLCVKWTISIPHIARGGRLVHSKTIWYDCSDEEVERFERG